MVVAREFHPTVWTVCRNLQSVGYPTIPEAVVKGRLTSRKHEQRTTFVSMHSRRLDDRILDLCAKLVGSSEYHEVDQILSELRLALHESIERLRGRVAAALSGRRDFPEDRRKAS